MTRSVIGYTNFPDGFAQTMSAREVDIAYPIFDGQTKYMVEILLAYSGDGPIMFGHHKLDASELAIRAISTHIGRTLPAYDGGHSGSLPVGQTRVINPEDVFRINEGPVAIGPGFYRSVFQRASAEMADPILLTSSRHDVRIFNPRTGTLSPAASSSK